MEELYLSVGFYVVNAAIILFSLGLLSSAFIYFVLKFRPVTIFAYRASMYVSYRAWKRTKDFNYRQAFFTFWTGKKKAQGKKLKKYS